MRRITGKVSLVLAAALMALPIFAEQKPTPTPAANRGHNSGTKVAVTVTPTSGPVDEKIISSGKGKMPAYGRLVGTDANVTPTSGPVEAVNSQQQKAERAIIGWTTPTKVGPVPPTYTPNSDQTHVATPTKTLTPTITRTKYVERTPTRTPTGVANRSINLNSSKSNRVQPTAKPK